jgi:hypothetical protein
MKSRLNWLLHLWLRLNGWSRVSKEPAPAIWRKRVGAISFEVFTAEAVRYELHGFWMAPPKKGSR